MFKSSDTYINIIDWNARLKREIPVLKEIIDSLDGSRSLKILDIGCGPGMHLNNLVQNYTKFKFLGLDLNSEFIEYARNSIPSNLQQIEFKILDFLEGDLSSLGRFDFIYSLGNSLMLIWGDFGADSVFSRISHLTNSNGYLFFQILNSDKPRNGYKTSKIYQTEDKVEYFTVKRFDPEEDGSYMNIEFITFYKTLSESKYNLEMHKNRWKMLSLGQLKEILTQNSFKIVEIWQNYKKEDFKPDQADSLLLLAKKI